MLATSKQCSTPRIEHGEAETSWSGVLQGTWSMPGHPHPWMDQGISAMLDMSMEPGVSVRLHGGLSIGGNSLYLKNVVWDAEGCWETPTGTVQIRDPGGFWYTLLLDEDCSGCGIIAYSDGTRSTEVCPELGSLRSAIETSLVPE